MNFSQWRIKADRGEVKKVTYICGDERVLIEEVLDFVKSTLAVGDFDFARFQAGVDSDRDIWTAVNTYPSRPELNRLVVVRDAERISNWDPYVAWLEDSRATPTCYLVLVDNGRDFPYLRDEDGKAKGLPDYLETGRSKVHMVRCIAPWGGDPSKGTEGQDLVAWFRRRSDVKELDVLPIMALCRGSLTRADALLRKAELFAGPLDVKRAQLLVDDAAGEDFVDALVARDKPRALSALPSLDPREYTRVVGQLDAALDTLGKVHVLLRAGKTMRELATEGKTGVPFVLIKHYYDAARFYDNGKRRECRSVLAQHDAVLRSGAREAVMESLVASW